MYKITTHTADGLDRLISQYKNKTKFKGFITAHIDGFQSLEDVFYSLLDRLDIDLMTGVQLDNFGKIVGQTRIQGQSDAEYILYLKGKILINISNGTPEEIITLTKILSNSTKVILIENFPAAITMSIDGTIASGLISIFKLLIKKAVGAGISIDFISKFNPTESFSYKGTIAEGAKGYSSVYDTTKGGYYAEVLQ